MQTIVIVDDAPMVLRLVGQYLKVLGVKTLNCHNAAIAHRVIAQARPQLVILDINMPEVDGIEVFQQLRADPATRTIPVIFLTVNDDILWERLPNFEAQGGSIFSKMNLAGLAERVQQVLGNRNGYRQTAITH
jgi:CheY-like chemotaxis protein